MILKDISGNILYEGDGKTIKESLEYCAKNNISLKGLYVRGARIRGANLDGLIAPSSCFWGCDVSGSDIGYANLQGADFRTANLEDVCFSNTNLTAADMQGAYFSGTLLDGAVFDHVKISCPSFWGCDLSTLSSLKGLTFYHKGVVELVLHEAPLVIRHKAAPLIIVNNHCLQESSLYPSGVLPDHVRSELFAAKVLLEKILKERSAQIAKRTMPKISGQTTLS